MRTSKRGSVLAVVMAVVLAAALLATAGMRRAVRGSRMAGWSQDHLALRLVAESVVEEVWADLQDQANAPGNAVYEALRAGAGGEVEVAGLSAAAIAADAQGMSVSHRVKLLKRTGLSADAGEVAGLVRIEATARLAGAVERVRVDRSFQVARTVLPAPLDGLALFVLDPDVPALGTVPMQAPADASARSLVKMFTDRRFQPVPAELSQGVAAALSTFSAESLGRRAQFVTETAEHLMTFLGARLGSGRSVNGLIFNRSDEPVRLPKLAGWRGRAVLVVPGDVRVSDVSVAEPGRDALTIVSGGRIVVDGRTVEANLLTLTPGKGVVFARQARIAGTVISSRFPRGPRLSKSEMEACEFGTVAVTAAPYFVTFSVQPVSQEHRRQGEEWSEW